MDGRGRKQIVKKGEAIKTLLEEHDSLLVVGEAECGKSMLCGYLENSLKEEPFVIELSEIKNNRKHKLKDLTTISQAIVLIDDADKLNIDSIINNLSSLNGKKIVLFSRNNDFVELVKEHVSLVKDFSQF